MRQDKQTTFDYATNYYKFSPLYYLGKGTQIRLEIAKRLIGKNKKVLDVGCYDGVFGEQFIKNRNTVYGIDASRAAVKLAKKKGVKAVVGDLETTFPFKSDEFDSVFAGEIIEHMLDTDFFVEEVRRVLKPKGEFIVTTPNVASLARRFMLLLGMNPYFEASFNFPKNVNAGHVRYYTRDVLESFLKHHGFEIVSFQSDVVNFTEKFGSKLVADIFPTLGRGLIFKCKKV